MSTAVFADLFLGLQQQGPGSDEETRHALALLPFADAPTRILDAGCGTGRQTRVLARETGGKILALDLSEPFIAEAQRLAEADGLAHAIDARVGNMACADQPDGAFDLIWSEGAIYNLGFEAGLAGWRRLLRPGGCVAATEASWLVPEPSANPSEFWQRNYPGMGHVDANLAAARRVGYRVIDHFTLAAASWWLYYDEQAARMPQLRQKYSADPDALGLLDEIQLEYDLYRDHGDEYGYVFYLLGAD